MADLSLTPANVKPCGDPRKNKFMKAILGATLTAGQVVRIATASGKAVAASDDSAANAAVVGIVVKGGGDTEPGIIQTGGFIDLGVALPAAGQHLLVGTNGGIAPLADAGTYVTRLGVIHSERVLDIDIQQHGAF